MIEEKELEFRYLNKREDFELIHDELAAWVVHHGDEPLGPFEYAKFDELDALLGLPKQEFFGREAYPTLAEKAGILFYTINKSQIFVNGNKRMSTLTLLVFLGLNEKTLNVTPDDLTAKALWLANTDSLDFQAIKEELVRWINEHLIKR